MGNTAASWKNATKKLSNGYEKLTDTILKHKKIAIPLLYVILIAIPFLGRASTSFAFCASSASTPS